MEDKRQFPVPIPTEQVTGFINFSDYQARIPGSKDQPCAFCDDSGEPCACNAKPEDCDHINEEGKIVKGLPGPYSIPNSISRAQAILDQLRVEIETSQTIHKSVVEGYFRMTKEYEIERVKLEKQIERLTPNSTSTWFGGSCTACGANLVVCQANSADYWWYCSQKGCKNHDPGEQLGDMEECSFRRDK